MLEYVSQVTELNEISKYLQDDTLDEAMDFIIKTVMNQKDIPPTQIPKLIWKVSGISGVLKMKAKYYMLFGKEDPEASRKKNVFLTCAEALDKIVDSMKYMAKSV